MGSQCPRDGASSGAVHGCLTRGPASVWYRGRRRQGGLLGEKSACLPRSQSGLLGGEGWALRSPSCAGRARWKARGVNSFPPDCLGRASCSTVQTPLVHPVLGACKSGINPSHGGNENRNAGHKPPSSATAGGGEDCGVASQEAGCLLGSVKKQLFLPEEGEMSLLSPPPAGSPARQGCSPGTNRGKT